MAFQSGWLVTLLALAALKLAAGLAGFLVPPPPSAGWPSPFPIWIHGVHIVLFSAAATLLLLGGRRDRRAIFLGATYLVGTSVFADRLIFRLASALDSPWAEPLLLLRMMRLEAFMPALWWLFFRDFPGTAPFGLARRVPRIAIPVSLAVGTVLFAANLAAHLGVSTGPSLQAHVPAPAHFWTLIIALTLPAFPFAVWKMRMAGLTERRRVRLFVAGLAIGVVPMLVDVLAETILPPLRAWMDQPAIRRAAGMILYPLLLSVPFTTAYSVVVDRVLDVRLVVRRALRYALARYSVAGALAVPFVAFAVYSYERRAETLATLFRGAPPFLLLIAIGIVTLAQRRRIFAAIDRRFFREQYDARRVLTELTESSRRASSPHELSRMVVARVDAALHLDSIAMLVLEPLTGQLVAGDSRIRPLSVSSALATLAGGDVQPLEVDLEHPGSPLRRLPEDERQWLADGGFRLLVPFLGNDGALLGLLALGEKKSELPFDSEDRALLAALAGAAALTLENRLLRESPAGRLTPASGETYRDPGRVALESEQEVLAGECTRCGTVYPQRISTCTACGGAVAPGLIPYVLSGKFRFERRVGQGGMGVVYRATDLVLQRPVAIKTLPRVSPEAALRLRREARAAARIVHAGLAQIFGAESWRGTPMLIFEFLEAGTLADRIAIRPLSPVETVRMGISVADVLDRAHAAGILHGDIKPSNVGYRIDGSVAVLDFGVARMLSRTEVPIPVVAGLASDVSNLETGFHLVPADAVLELKDLAGTLAYVSAEALAGAPADPAFDVWSLAVVLYESITGRNPFAAAGILETTARIRAAAVPPVLDSCPTCPPELAALLHEALHRDPSRRPSSARQFRMLLQHALPL